MTQASLKFLFTGMVVPFLVACAPGHLLIDRADIDGIEERLDRHDAHLSDFEQTQVRAHETLSLEQRLAAGALMQTMVAEFSRLSCEPAPAPVMECDEADTVRRESPPPRQGGRTVMQINDRQVIGGVEHVVLAPPGHLFEARIDTGAESASLDARDMQEFERDGNRWVRFKLVDREKGEEIELERRIKRHVRILQSSAEESERRPVVEFQVTIGEITQTAEFTLSNRSHLTFTVLIGRNVLQDVMVVDVSRSNIAPPRLTTSEADD